MVKILMMMAVAVIMSSGQLFAAPAVAKSPFPKPPAQASQSLKVTKGKPFTAGYVFVNGKYIVPPYTVERFGTVIRINGVQVSREIVPWTEFIKTQDGVTVTKSEAAPAGGGGDDDDLFSDSGSDDPEPEEEEEDDMGDLFDDDDSSSSLDDLFDDEPKPKKKAAAKKPAKKKKKAPKPKKPAVTVNYSFDGEFVMNEKSRELLKKINDRRTKIDTDLRNGGYYFFGSRYSTVSTGDKGAAKQIFDKLPEIMKSNSSKDKFFAGIRAARLNYLPEPLLEDIFRCRTDYIMILERRKSEQESRKWQKLMGE